jgi:hypothetical protein
LTDTKIVITNRKLVSTLFAKFEKKFDNDLSPDFAINKVDAKIKNLIFEKYHIYRDNIFIYFLLKKDNKIDPSKNNNGIKIIKKLSELEKIVIIIS